METNFVEYPFKTMWRALLTYLFTLVFLAGGISFGITGIMNLLVFVSFIYAFLMFVLLFTSSDGLKPAVPLTISSIFFGIMIFVLVYNAYFFTGAAWLISGLILGHLTDEYRSNLEERAAKSSGSVSSSVLMGNAPETAETAQNASENLLSLAGQKIST